MTTNISTDVVVIGAGPVGLFSIFACGQLGMRCHVIDALDSVGGQCAALYPEKAIYDIPGFPEVAAAELVERLSRQVAPFRPQFDLNQQAISLDVDEQGLTVATSAGLRVNARAVFVAAGCGAFVPNRPPLEGIAALEGSSVLYWVTRLEAFRQKRVVIAGGGDSAVDWALALSQIAETVTLVHRRDRFRASPASLEELKRRVDAGSVSIKVPFQLSALECGDGTLSAVLIADLDGQKERIPADILLPCFGMASDLGPLKTFGLAMAANQIDVDPLTMETSIDGIYAIGDVANYVNKQKLIVTGFAEAVTAARAAFGAVFPDRTFRFQHSTDRGAPAGFA